MAMPFDQFYHQHIDFVWRMLKRMGIQGVDLSDVCQDVFLAAERTLAGFDGRSSSTTWLFTLCRSAARDHRQRAHRRRELPASDQLDRYSAAPAGERSIEQREQLELLGAVLSSIPEAQALVFVLFELEQLSGSEISQQLNVSEATVHSRLRLARQAFELGLARWRKTQTRLEGRWRTA